MKIRPLGDRILVQMEEAEEKTKSGIIVPNAYAKDPNIAKVVEIGPGVDSGLNLKKDTHIVIAPFSGVGAEIEEGRYLVIGQEDVLAIVE